MLHIALVVMLIVWFYYRWSFAPSGRARRSNRSIRQAEEVRKAQSAPVGGFSYYDDE